MTQIAAGWRHSLALRGDGQVVAWGADADGVTSSMQNRVFPNVERIAASYDSSFVYVAATGEWRRWVGGFVRWQLVCLARCWVGGLIV